MGVKVAADGLSWAYGAEQNGRGPLQTVGSSRLRAILIVA
jgi:hypothetical protein